MSSCESDRVFESDFSDSSNYSEPIALTNPVSELLVELGYFDVRLSDVATIEWIPALETGGQIVRGSCGNKALTCLFPWDRQACYITVDESKANIGAIVHSASIPDDWFPCSVEEAALAFARDGQYLHGDYSPSEIQERVITNYGQDLAFGVEMGNEDNGVLTYTCDLLGRNGILQAGKRYAQGHGNEAESGL